MFVGFDEGVLKGFGWGQAFFGIQSKGALQQVNELGESPLFRWGGAGHPDALAQTIDRPGVVDRPLDDLFRHHVLLLQEERPVAGGIEMLEGKLGLFEHLL